MIPLEAFFAITVPLGLVILWRELSYRRQVRSLIQRLDELDSEPEEKSVRPQPSPRSEQAHENPSEESAIQAAADVLQGKTSFVRRIVEGGRPEDLRLEEQAILAVNTHIEESFSPARLAEELHISLRTLERGLSGALQCTPRELIVAMKMREALRLMRDEKYSVTAVAYHLGFSSPSHFSRRFKAFYRKSPSTVTRRANSSR